MKVYKMAAVWTVLIVAGVFSVSTGASALDYSAIVPIESPAIPTADPTATTTNPSTTTNIPHPIITTDNPTITTTTPTTTIATETPTPILTTANGTQHTITLPADVTAARILLWADWENTRINLQVLSGHRYESKFNVTKTKVWHFIDIYQPVEARNQRASLNVYPASTFTTLEYLPVKQVLVSSDLTTKWIFCPNAYACAMLPPPTPTHEKRSLDLADNPNPSEAENEAAGPHQTSTNPLLPPLLVVSLLLAFCCLALVIVSCYSKKEKFHHYEKPFWPPHPPPLPYPVRQVETNIAATVSEKPEDVAFKNPTNDVTTKITEPHRATDITKEEPIKSQVTIHQPISVSSPESPVAEWPKDRQVITIFPDQESVNSLYGLILHDNAFP